MSTKKFKEIQNKYSIREDTLKKLYENDLTPTKKYFEFMAKMWSSNKSRTGMVYVKLKDLYSTIQEFDKMLPYIKNKDIYSSYYNTYQRVKDTIEEAKNLKIEKTFNKEDHLIVVHETDTYLMIYPKTHFASTKYGANTRWCTASKNKYTFNSYQDQGVLMYVIDKTKKRKKNYEKLAFYGRKDNDFNTQYYIYNAYDSTVGERGLTEGNWTIEELMELDMHFRFFLKKKQKIRNSENYIKNTLSKIKSIDIERLKKEMAFIESYNKKESFQDLEKGIKEFIEKIKQF